LCGGLGTRIGLETKFKPKPMILIGGKPILWHLMTYYKNQGFNNFILAAGYKYKIIKKYFKKNKEFKTKVVNTGLNTGTAGRIMKIKKYLNKKNDYFLMTYGDGLSDVNLKKIIKFHISNKKIATLTAVHPPVRFGELKFKKNLISKFEEKPQTGIGWINAGFFVLNKKIFKYLTDTSSMLEREPLSKMSQENQLAGYKHYGFWHCVDTVRDKKLLEKIIKDKKTFWLNEFL
jgi:glucose-1-phosphate cytidylyltransferase